MPEKLDMYDFHRCYMQRGNKKYVRLYSDHYWLLANANEGHCRPDEDDQFLCGLPTCTNGPECSTGMQGSYATSRSGYFV